MADTTTTASVANGEKKATPSGPRPLSKHQQLNKLYALPAPLRTFPLPTLVPHNPLSLFHVLFVWLSQTIKPESTHPDPLYQGWFSAETRSVHVTDSRSIRGLWEQGFYGKGSLSRSEPSWLKRENTKRGTKERMTSEEVTRQRRAERQRTKWERARKEREAIDQTLSEEAQEAQIQMEEAQLISSDARGEDTIAMDVDVFPLPKWTFLAPVDPLSLLALPDSAVDLPRSYIQNSAGSGSAKDLDDDCVSQFQVPNDSAELFPLQDKLPCSLGKEDPPLYANGNATHHPPSKADTKPNGTVSRGASGLGLKGLPVDEIEVVGGSETNDDTAEGSQHSEDTVETTSTTPTSATANGSSSVPNIKRQKSVRFSPTVERNTFIQTEPPSPQHADIVEPIEEAPLVINDQEHTQLTLEEAFFLSYGLGALEILDPATRSAIPQQNLFRVFRHASHFPPVANPPLSPDDSFMLNYVAYHHYRSLGWVPRSGVKFSVDLMLYIRGPVFTHAEFGVIILPSYSDPYWSSSTHLQKYVKGKEQRTWAWISCINRVITQVKKTLILTYVDIPAPLEEEEEEKMGVDAILARYKIKEIVMKRWVANRSRD